jgi:GT2 family glycosyltransferase
MCPDDSSRQRHVSVLIPSFNSRPYLVQAVASAIAQRDVAIEVIVQDGGSTDGSIEELSAIEDPRLHWISEPDAGQSDALNRALQRATGEFVIWLNADDLLKPNAACELLAAARARRLKIAHGNYEIISEGGDVIKPYSSAPLDRSRLIRHGTYIFSGALLIDRRVLLQIGGFDPGLHYCMDYDLLLRLADAGVRSGQIAEVVAQFRRQPRSKSETARVQFLRERVRVLRRHGGTWFETLRRAVISVAYQLLQPLWRSRLWLRIRPRKHLGGF